MSKRKPVPGQSADVDFGSNIQVAKVSSSTETVIAMHTDRISKRSIVSKREAVPGDVSDIEVDSEVQIATVSFLDRNSDLDPS